MTLKYWLVRGSLAIARMGRNDTDETTVDDRRYKVVYSSTLSYSVREIILDYVPIVHCRLVAESA